MIYGLDTRLPDENAAAWRKLDERSRLRLVERELKPANDRIDGYPLAL
ncbi:MAG: hypothetical protein H0U34_02095 [Sphingomonas sp.]|jgi:hypothetical protein|nr:hypothetical protein [Sphingomonas sp.]